MSNQTSKTFSPLPSHFYGLWSEYWNNLGHLTPPVHYYKETIGSGALMVTAVGETQIKEFIKSQKNSTKYLFAAQGQALLDERRWLGHWSTISIDFYTPALLPLINPLNTPVPGTEGWN